MYKEYKISDKKKKIILFSLSLIIIATTIVTIKDIYLFYKNSIVKIGESSIGYSVYDSSQTFSLGYLFYIAIFIVFVYDITIKNINMIIDDYGIKIYSLHRKSPNITIAWENVESFQIGEVYMGTRFTKYGMKIRFLNNNSQNEDKVYISIRSFENYNQFLEDIEKIADEKNIKLLFMND
ncbi:hypothetical protein [Tepidibacter mesophilus]|uniref:hypothetical protein n=1 Tax=Tepidibacter mesophilus TaxID=655607 RepID=UPI000C077A5F|nr:hypothetical protein [Tepidibacter mesophilus]